MARMKSRIAVYCGLRAKRALGSIFQHSMRARSQASKAILRSLYIVAIVTAVYALAAYGSGKIYARPIPSESSQLHADSGRSAYLPAQDSLRTDLAQSGSGKGSTCATTTISCTLPSPQAIGSTCFCSTSMGPKIGTVSSP